LSPDYTTMAMWPNLTLSFYDTETKNNKNT
jgi:hypothetical protein